MQVPVKELTTHPVALLDNVLETQETVFVIVTATFMAIAVKTLWKYAIYKVCNLLCLHIEFISDESISYIYNIYIYRTHALLGAYRI